MEYSIPKKTPQQKNRVGTAQLSAVVSSSGPSALMKPALLNVISSV
jgi:hypothetical protein